MRSAFGLGIEKSAGIARRSCVLRHLVYTYGGKVQVARMQICIGEAARFRGWRAAADIGRREDGTYAASKANPGGRG